MTSWALAVCAVLVLLASAGSAGAQARIDGISGTNFDFTAGAGEVSTPDGGSIHFWGYNALKANSSTFPSTRGRP